MTDLTDMEAQIQAILQDTGAIAWTTAELDAALRLALAEYSKAQPVETETVITLASAGREITLTGIADLAGITGVLDVWWPYVASAETWPPNRVAGFRTWLDGSNLVLFLSSKDGSQPRTGDKVRLWWAKPHTINALDGAAATTLTSEGKALAATGAAGFAAATGTLDLSEVLDIEVLWRWGNSMLGEFRSRLEMIRAEAVRSRGEPFGGGWQMDKWDASES
jgi:hypothetical protein